MAEHRRMRLLLGGVLALSAVAFLLQLTVVRPHLWPAGAAVALSSGGLFPSLEATQAIPRLRPPNVADPALSRIAIARLRAGGNAGSRRRLSVDAPITPAVGAPVVAVEPRDGPVIQLIDPARDAPRDSVSIKPPADLLRVWREGYWLGPVQPVRIHVIDSGVVGGVSVERLPVWQLDAATRREWLRTHAGPLLQTATFLAGAAALFALGTSGMTAILMTLALVMTAIANSGSLMGAERAIPLVGDLLVVVGWLATPLAFPIIGLAVLHFPSKAPILERHRWLPAALGAAAAPMFVISLSAALLLLGADSVLPTLAWLSTRGWLFDASFVIALAANVAIVVEGIGRYRRNTDPNERRRIQLIVFTGVAAVFAYAIRVGVPLLSSLAGYPMALHWIVGGTLQLVVLLPAFALPYAVAVRHVFSPRTVLRRSLQYALARRTLSLLIALPIAALAISLIAGRDRPLGDIILGQPLFYVGCLALAALGLRNRDAAQRWLDRRFFRAEYDAREILLSLASRVPYESDPRELVAMVLTQIDSALHPESAAVLAGNSDRLEVVSALRCSVDPLPREDALVILLRWSDEPLEVFLDDERSQVARLPQSDRNWLAKSGAALLVPILTGTGETKFLVGIVVLGQKRSEERYTAEDRKLLGGIAAQMGVAIDLSRLRRTAATATPGSVAASDTPTRMPSAGLSTPMLGICPSCQRCYDLASFTGPRRCPDDREELEAVMGMPPVVDSKYRVDSVVGRGGMGAVFRARDLRLDRDVAIKIVRADLVADPESRARFRREAQIVARLQHPAIVTVFDYGNLADGAAFLVMEFVKGEDLRRVLRREQTLSQDRTVDLITGVAMGVEAAHQAGVLHRDLKPENVILPASGSGPKVLDFGVAKITDTSGAGGTVTHGATVVGTPAYMAPEQLRGDQLDARADVFSLGVMTYEALTGTLPFGTGSFIDIGIKQASVIDMSKLPPSLVAALLRALAFDREQRPAGPAAFAAELRSTN